MSGDEYRDLVIKHDKHIDKVADSVEHLAKAVGSTNRKLDDVIEVINKQNVLMERVSNMEINLKESFSRVHARLDLLENTHVGSGCSAMRLAIKNEDVIKEDLVQLEKETKHKFDKIDSNLTWIVRLIIGGLVSGAIGTLVILVRGVH